MSSPKGFPSQQKETDRTRAEFTTVEPVRENQYGLTTHSMMFVTLIATKTVAAGPTSTKIPITAHGALKGDVIRFSSGTIQDKEVMVLNVIDANTVEIAETLSSLPTAGDSVEILRFRHPRIDQLGGAIISGTVLEFGKDGATVDVSEDTVTPSNNIPLPVKLLNANGEIIGQKAMAQSIPVAIASDQSAVPISNAHLDANLSTLATEITLSALNTKVTACDTGNVTVASSALPTGAATSAKQDTGNTSLSSIDSKIPAKGQALMTGSTPVVIASDQSAVPVSAASLPLPTGAATEATLSTLNGKVTACDTGNVTIGAALPAGTNVIGKVDVNSDPSEATDAQLGLPTKSTVIAGYDGANVRTLKTDATGALNITGSISAVVGAPANGSAVTGTATTTAATVTAPANAEGFIIQATDTNTDAIRFAIGGTVATAALGYKLLPGADREVGAGVNISVISLSGSQEYNIIWIIK